MILYLVVNKVATVIFTIDHGERSILTFINVKMSTLTFIKVSKIKFDIYYSDNPIFDNLELTFKHELFKRMILNFVVKKVTAVVFTIDQC